MILKRYINSEILRTSVAILVVLILIFISTRFIKYIQLAVEGTISSQAVFSLLGLQIPSVTGFLIPLSFFIAILLTMGRLYSDNEMAVIHSVGVSDYQIAKNILPVAMILALLSFLLAFWVTPWSSQQTKSLLTQEKAEAKFGAFTPGRFQENSSKTGVVFAESKDTAGVISGIFSVTGLAEDADKLQIQIAENGHWSEAIVTDSSGEALLAQPKGASRLVLENGVTYVFEPKTRRWSTTEYAKYAMRIIPGQIEAAALKNKSKSTAELLDNPKSAQWAELHWRLSAPLQIPILCFLAIPLARTQPRKGKFSRLLPAMMVYLVYALLLMNGRRFIETGQIPYEIGFWWIHTIAIVLSIWLYRPTKVKTKVSRKPLSV